jgi:hypothetical protein
MNDKAARIEKSKWVDAKAGGLRLFFLVVEVG